ncbi:MAG TPA: hypothetical protein VFI37_09295 [Gaiellaceae bacterium]|nr:hypothetical protein [Gaiellaceae bacterium]
MRMLGLPLLGVLAVAAGCGASASPSLTVRVEGTAARRSTSACLFSIRANVAGGGRQTTCLTRVDGYPGPKASMHSRGRMTFALPHGTLRARVQIVQRFRADGAHAKQTVSGTITGGSGRYAGARGTIRGGGAVVDSRSGLRGLDLVYRIALG